MRWPYLGAGALGLAILALSPVSAGEPLPNGSPHAAGIPRTQKPLAEKDDRLRFVIIGDRTSEARPGVFERAMEQINWLQPNFVISVGDLIEGYTEDTTVIKGEWDEVENAIDALQMPFFHVVGNHDMGNDILRQVWKARLGQDYYHFVKDGVLFIALNTEDPPSGRVDRAKLFADVPRGDLARLFAAMQSDEAAQTKFFTEKPELKKLVDAVKASEKVSISKAQVDYVRKALADNAHARWTMIFMHRPAWRAASPEFAEIERMLANRPYTVIAGHYHAYAYEQRHGRDYIVMGTTGGKADAANPNAMDHVMLVTMGTGKSGPEMANIKLDGFYDRKGPSATPAATKAP